MNDPKLPLDFMKLLIEFRGVERMLLATGLDRKENDVEHSYQLAMLSWYCIEVYSIPLNISKVLRYTLVHDLVEVYAGDTYFHSKDEAIKNSKVEREAKALNKLYNDFPECSPIFDCIVEYEKKEDEEARFVYALDKLMPIFNIYLDGGKTWKNQDISLEMVLTKDKKVASSKYVYEIWEHLIEVLKNEEAALFS